MTPLERAIAAFPTATAFASAIGAPVNLPSMWKARCNVPAEWCPAIERVTKARGSPVLCEELRPDIPWDVLREQSNPSPA
ncbi:MAG: YdaS family helix-turn-helix protein [Burkholderiales bacterium]